MSSKPWYRWYSADYKAKTAHLDFIRDAAYRRLLDAYYEYRGPLPADLNALYRITGAQTQQERIALRSVCDEFFTNGEGTIRQARADEELAEWDIEKEKRSKAGTKGNDKRWQRHRNRIALRSQSDRHSDSDSYKDKPLGEVSPKTPLLAQALELLAFLNTKTGRTFRPLPANTELIVLRLREGATLQECKSMIAKKCRDWQDDDKMRQFLRPKTLFNKTNFANYLGELINVQALPRVRNEAGE